MYKRYIDTFMLFKKREHVQLFLRYLNKQHEKISFTSETESNNKLNFLDILVEKCQNGFNTLIFRKTTHTGLGMKFHSFISYLFKTNLISCLIKRAFLLCSTEILFIDEFNYLRRYFLQNNFPIKLIKITAARTLNSLYNPKTTCQSVQMKRIYIELPFLGSHGHIYERKLK